MTTDREAERLARIRERAFYLSLTRTGPPDPDADWIEAEAAEAAAEAVAPEVEIEPAPPEPPAPEPPAPEPLAPELSRLDRDLAVLAARLKPEEHARLAGELVRTNTGDVQADASWDVAAMQIHLFAELARRDCLQSIGERPAWSTAARHRCSIGVKGVSLSVEVQPEPAAGPSTERPPSDDAPESVSPFPRQLLPPFKKLLETRAKEDAPFLLASVRLPSAPGEAENQLSTLELVAKKASAGAALLANSASSLWLGLLELDLRAESPRMRLVVRPAASWPLFYRDLAASLDASVAVL